MRTLRLYVGEGFWSAKFVRHLLDLHVIDGATILPARGFWRDDENHVIVEAAEVLVFATDYIDGVLISYAIEHMTKHTNEQAIMVESADGTVTFEERRK